MEENKLYYNIGEVAKMFDVNASLIRFWEKEFGSLHNKKNAKGNRKFTAKDIARFKKIYQLVKVKGYTLEGAKKELKNGGGVLKLNNVESIISRLEDIKRKIKAL